MPTEFKNETTIPVSLQQYIETIHNPEYWEKLATVISENGKIDSKDIGTDTVKINSTVYVPKEDLPAPMQALKPDGLIIERQETWSIQPHEVKASFELRIQESPASMSGTTIAKSSGSHSTIFTTQAHAEVKIPLFGKKIETGVIDNISTILDKERDFTVAWVKEHH